MAWFKGFRTRQGTGASAVGFMQKFTAAGGGGVATGLTRLTAALWPLVLAAGCVSENTATTAAPSNSPRTPTPRGPFFSPGIGTLFGVPKRTPEAPLIIAHRGASSQRPEHTLAAYERAIEHGADYIEPDLVPTRDGILIARHENELSTTTDVAEKFPARRAVKIIDGQKVEGFFSEDFTLAEIKTLRAKERLPHLRGRAYDGRFEVPTFQEILVLVQRRSAETGKKIGLYPEIKHPSYFRSIGLPLEERLALALSLFQLNEPDAPVFIQSFEPQSLRRLKKLTRNKLMLLLADSGAPYDFLATGDRRTYRELVSTEGLAEIATYADAIGPHKRLLFPVVGAEGSLGKATSLVRDAHAAGLLVHPWTFRNEDAFLANEHKGNPQAELREMFTLGVDGVFVDDPESALAARRKIFRK